MRNNNNNNNNDNDSRRRRTAVTTTTSTNTTTTEDSRTTTFVKCLTIAYIVCLIGYHGHHVVSHRYKSYTKLTTDVYYNNLDTNNNTRTTGSTTISPELVTNYWRDQKYTISTTSLSDTIHKLQDCISKWIPSSSSFNGYIHGNITRKHVPEFQQRQHKPEITKQRRNLVQRYSRHRRLGFVQQQQQQQQQKSKQRVLYIITTLSEYNTGTRNTVRGSDRLQETTIPIIVDGVTSMIDAGYSVDVYLICHFTLIPEREQLVRTALTTISKTIQLKVWNDATPLGYDTSKKKFTKLEYRTLHLARQHRFVIKDNIIRYDMFVNFEDDMLIKGDHLNHFRAVTNELDRLYQAAPDDYPADKEPNDVYKHYYGIMTKGQLQRIIPGFIRTEVLLDENKYPAQSDTGPVPVNLHFGSSKKKKSTKQYVNSTICCAVSSKTTNANRPLAPTTDLLMIWETNIFPLGVRKMPEHSWLDWVVLQRGPSQSDIPPTTVIGDYWTNRNKDYYGTKPRPGSQEFKYINNQGGWMATQSQIVRWHTMICLGGFLPPYYAPHYRYDGLDMRNVEWYSGGMQLSTARHACNMQRIVLLNPCNFSKSLLYHSANNKQRQLTDKRDEFFTKANTLLGQLNTIKLRAETEIQ